MSYQFVGRIDTELVRLLETKAHRRGGPSRNPALVFDGGGDIDTTAARRALDGGSTIAIVNARAGQLADLAPGTGVDVPADLALFAVKRVPIEGRPGRTHAIVTMVPKPDAVRVRGVRISETGTHVAAVPPRQGETDKQRVADELDRHVTVEIALDQALFPPEGAKYGVLSYVYPSSMQVQQTNWPEHKGAAQTLSTRTVLTYYIYYANGTAPHQYFMLMVQNGNASPASGGALCADDENEKAFVSGSVNLATDVMQGPAVLLNTSPAGTITSPVEDRISQPMIVNAIGDGGTQPRAFTAAVDNDVPNADWGVTPISGTNANTAAWMYYNITGWNALTQAAEDFGQWGGQMYDSDKHVIALDITCQSSTSWETLACWQVPANPNNASPLTVQLGFMIVAQLVGFANPTGSGTDEAWMTGAGNKWWFSQPVWDLVAVTGSGQDAAAFPLRMPTEAKA